MCFNDVNNAGLSGEILSQRIALHSFLLFRPQLTEAYTTHYECRQTQNTQIVQSHRIENFVNKN